ncbi:MAG: hypothetical protein H6621_09815 [Halobacteriovoraceae bacterium]|nr:hypothetical protein [Halobacteriovoraceae bacterium]MCB9095353.1 hypothetical protein [Halobacteriovoraceae bacterium]
MRTHNLTKFFNLLLITFALLLFYICFKHLQLSDTTNQLNLEQFIGEISKHQNTVQLKHPGQIAWGFVSDIEKSNLVENDQVFTHKDSEATVTLKNKQKLTIQSESLVRIKSLDKIVVQNGQVDLNLNENQPELSIQIGNQEYKLKATEKTQISIKKNFNQSSFQVDSGTVQLTTKKEKLNLNSGTITEIKNENAKTLEATTKLLYPSGTIILKKKKRINFKFQTKQDVEKIYIQRTDKEFFIDKNKSMNLKPGSYKWGVVYRGETHAKSLENFTLIHEINPPTPISPINNATIQLAGLDQQIEFRWKSQSRVLFEIINEQGEIFYSNISKENKLTTNFEKPGQYSWRIKVQDSYIQSEYSQSNYFFVTKIHEIEDFRTIEIKRPNQLVKVNITPVGNTEDAQYIISNTKEFKNVITKGKLKNNSFEFIADKAGFYYWKIVNPDGNISLKKVLVIPTPAPKRAPKVKDIIKRFKVKSSLIEKIFNFIFPQAYAADPAIKITWEEIKDVKEYEIEIIDNLKDKKILLKKTTTKPSLTWIPPSNKTFYYRVRYKDFWDRFSPFSEYARILIESEKPVAMEEQKIEKNIPEKQKSIFYELDYLYSQVDYKQKLSTGNEIKIKGQSTTGHAFSYRHFNIFNSKYNFVLNYKSQYGEVFNNQDYYQRQLSLSIGQFLYSFDIALGVEYLNTTLYEVRQSEVKLSRDYNKLAFSFFFGMTQNVGKNSEIQPFISLQYLDYQQTNLGINYWYHWNKSFSLNVKLSGEQTRISSQNDDIDSLSYQLFTGITL